MSPAAAARTAEVAFTVEEDLPRAGLASLLLKELYDIARAMA